MNGSNLLVDTNFLIYLLNGHIENCFIVNFNSDIKEIAIRIKQKSTIKVPDAIVAASAIYMSFPLITGDKDFLKIGGLELQLLNL